MKNKNTNMMTKGIMMIMLLLTLAGQTAFGQALEGIRGTGGVSNEASYILPQIMQAAEAAAKAADNFDYAPLQAQVEDMQQATKIALTDTLRTKDGRTLVRQRMESAKLTAANMGRWTTDSPTDGLPIWYVSEYDPALDSDDDVANLQVGGIFFGGWAKLSLHTARGVDKNGYMDADGPLHRVKVHTKLYSTINFVSLALGTGGWTERVSVYCYHDLTNNNTWKDKVDSEPLVVYDSHTTVNWQTGATKNKDRGPIVIETNAKAKLLSGGGYNVSISDIDGITKEDISGFLTSNLWIPYDDSIKTIGDMFHMATYGAEDILLRSYGIVPVEQYDRAWSYGTEASPLSELNYSNGIDLIVTGKGRCYSGTKTIHLNFVGIPLKSEWASLATTEDITYTGSALTPAVVVSDNGTLLKEGVDYLVEYENNINAGVAIINIIPDSGYHWVYNDFHTDSSYIAPKYAGSITRTFTIAPKSVTEDFIPTVSDQTYTGNPLTPAITVNDGRTTLTEGEDYSVAYLNNTNVGSGIVRITGLGNYGGTVDHPFAIVAKALPALSSVAQQTYNGNAFTPTITIKDNERTLAEGTDYTLTYNNNINVGTATIVATGMGNYSGTQTMTFDIAPHWLTDGVTIREASPTEQVYSGSALRLNLLTVAYGGKLLLENTDYTVAYSDNINVGKAAVTINGMGNYTGTLSTTFEIMRRSLSGFTVEVEARNYVYNNAAIIPNILVGDATRQLTVDRDYTLSLEDNVNAGTAYLTVTGVGNYADKLYGNFTITPRALGSGWVRFSGDNSFVYTGEAFRPDFTVVDGTKTLTPYVDYTWSYADNIRPGAATVTITGVGNYSGTQTANFTIGERTIDDSWLRMADKTYTATGEPICPAFVLIDYDNKRTLKPTADYTVTYSNNVTPGTATMVIYGTGAYLGSIMRDYTIVAAPAPDPNPYSIDTVEEETPEPLPSVVDIASEQISVSVSGSLENAIISVRNVNGTDYKEGIDWDLTWIIPGSPVLLQLTGKNALTGERYVWTKWISNNGNTDVEATVPAPTLRAASQGATLVLEGLQPGKPFALYTIEGRKAFSAVAPASGTYTLTTAAEGLYILEHAGQRIRIYHSPR